jgi:hypothetical protein
MGSYAHSREAKPLTRRHQHVGSWQSTSDSIFVSRIVEAGVSCVLTLGLLQIMWIKSYVKQITLPLANGPKHLAILH